MGRDVLLDTGPLVAVLDAGDEWHDSVRAAWPDLLTRCVTTEAVVTEACHLAGRGGAPAHLPLDFLLAAGIPVLGLGAEGHRVAARLMAQYRDVPMDYADATLVALSDPLDIDQVFTLDRRGFRTFRRAAGTGFTLL